MKQSENKHDTTDATPATLGGVIRQAREKRNISVRGLAEQLHMHQSYISRLEDNAFKHPSLEKLRQIADYLDLNYNDLCALAGYQLPSGLPTLLPYLRAKYEISVEDARSMNDHFEELRYLHGITEKANRP